MIFEILKDAVDYSQQDTKNYYNYPYYTYLDF